jgi:thioesterase domain-containing protein
LQPEGPYYLGGFCMGGQVAVEIAQRLVRDGQQVNLLFVIDTHNFNGVPSQSALGEKVGNLRQITYATEKIKIAVRREIERLRIKIVHLCKLNPDREVMGPREKILEAINDRAYLAYVPGVYPGKLMVCKSRRKHAFLRDHFNGWGGIAARGFEIVELPVDQGGIFIEPCVRVLAETLREKLDQAISVQTQALESELVLK